MVNIISAAACLVFSIIFYCKYRKDIKNKKKISVIKFETEDLFKDKMTQYVAIKYKDINDNVYIRYVKKALFRLNKINVYHDSNDEKHDAFGILHPFVLYALEFLMLAFLSILNWFVKLA